MAWPQTGDLRFSFRFDKQVEAADSSGGRIQSWTTTKAAGSIFRLAAVRASRTGAETVQAQRLASEQPYDIAIRYDSETCTIDPSWRAVEVSTGKTYALKSADDMDRGREWWTMLAVAGAADA